MTISVKDGAGSSQTISTLDDFKGAQATAQSTAVNVASDDAVVGPKTETAPATDTASSGLNGRLQRIAQRITSLIGLLPSSLGAKTAANSLSVTPASDQIDAGGRQMVTPDKRTMSLDVVGSANWANASGNAWTLKWTCPTGVNAKIIAGFAKFVTDATVLSRRICIQVKDSSGNVVYWGPPTNSQPASSTWAYTFGNGAPISQAGFPPFCIAFPFDLIMQPGWTLTLTTDDTYSGNTGAAGDVWSQYAIYYYQVQ